MRPQEYVAELRRLMAAHDSAGILEFIYSNRDSISPPLSVDDQSSIEGISRWAHMLQGNRGVLRAQRRAAEHAADTRQSKDR